MEAEVLTEFMHDILKNKVMAKEALMDKVVNEELIKKVEKHIGAI